MNLCESVRRKLRRHLNLDSWNSSTMPFEVESSKTLLHEATPDTATRNAGLLQNAKHHDAVHFVACASEVPLCTDMLCGEVSAARVSLAASIKSGKVPPRKWVIMHGNSPAKASFERNLIYMLIRQMSRSLCIFWCGSVNSKVSANFFTPWLRFSLAVVNRGWLSQTHQPHVSPIIRIFPSEIISFPWKQGILINFVCGNLTRAHKKSINPVSHIAVLSCL